MGFKLPQDPFNFRNLKAVFLLGEDLIKTQFNVHFLLWDPVFDPPMWLLFKSSHLTESQTLSHTNFTLHDPNPNPHDACPVPENIMSQTLGLGLGLMPVLG